MIRDKWSGSKLLVANISVGRAENAMFDAMQPNRSGKMLPASAPYGTKKL
jgi:hypothetical protein